MSNNNNTWPPVSSRTSYHAPMPSVFLSPCSRRPGSGRMRQSVSSGHGLDSRTLRWWYNPILGGVQMGAARSPSTGGGCQFILAHARPASV